MMSSVTDMAVPVLFNSFTKKKDPLETVEKGKIKWYICGPTVYDSAHLGHARNYVNFDVLRRVMSDYFGYTVTYVMNVTDIDDKIILRCHLNRLRTVVAKAEQLDLTASEPLEQARRTLVESEKDKEALMDAHESLTKEIQRVVPDYRDHDVQEEFAKLGRHFEGDFFEDMKSLGVRPPDALTRVSEYMPEVIAFISKIIERNYAYETDDGSVYFDVTAFNNSEGKTYSKLVPDALTNAELRAEGEGALTQGPANKRSPSDFVLWKSSKRGEPSWESPWGPGRPDILGSQVDINCGGVDLKFPHHENQLAQSEAYWDCCQWVKLFLHSGHLNTKGHKMSKSLKNFHTIRTALELYSAKQGFMQMEQAIAAETTFTEFLHSMKAHLREADRNPSRASNWTPAEKELLKTYLGLRDAVHDAFLDSVDTATVVKTLLELVKAVHVYLRRVGNEQARIHLLADVARYVSWILRILGLNIDGEEISIDVGKDASSNVEAILGSHLDVWTDFRNQIRQLARQNASPAEILKCCDQVRDVALPTLGVRIDDSGANGSIWKMYDPKELRKLMDQEEEENRKKEEAKRQRAIELQRKQEERDQKARIPPQDMFKRGEYEGMYSTYDEDGMPLTDKDNNELTKNAKKKLQKLHQQQRTAHQAWQQRTST